MLPGSYADLAGISGGDEIVAVENTPTPTWESTVLALLDASLDESGSVDLAVRDPQGGERHVQAHFDTSSDLLQAGGVLENFGLVPWRPPAVIDRLVAGGAGERAGLQPGDRIIRITSYNVCYTKLLRPNDWAWATMRSVASLRASSSSSV